MRAGAEKITKNGEGYVALIDAAQLDSYHQLAAKQFQLELLRDLDRGVDDVDAGRVRGARTALKELKTRRARR